MVLNCQKSKASQITENEGQREKKEEDRDKSCERKKRETTFLETPRDSGVGFSFELLFFCTSLCFFSAGGASWKSFPVAGTSTSGCT